MKHEIHNLQLIETAQEQQQFELEARKTIRRLSQFLKRYPRPLKLDIHVKKQDGTWLVSTTLPMQSRVLMCREKGRQSADMVNLALDCLWQQVKEQVRTERTAYLLKKREQLAQNAGYGKNDLRDIRQENDAEHFIFYLQQLLPGLKKYISVTAFKLKVIKPLLKYNKVRMVDVIQQVYHHLFARFSALHGGTEALPIWAIAETDAALQRLAKKYEYRFMKEIDYTENGIEAEWEKILFHADGQLFDREARSEENFFNPPPYNIAELLLDAGADDTVIEQAVEGHYDEKLHQWLYKLDLTYTSVFYLYYQMRFTVYDIARAKNQSEAEISDMLRDLGISLLTYIQQ